MCSHFFQLRTAIEKDIKEAGLKPHPSTILKVIQLYETKNSRYSFVSVSPYFVRIVLKVRRANSNFKSHPWITMEHCFFRHSTMLVGQTGSGKSVCWKILQASMTRLKRDGDSSFNIVRVKSHPIKSFLRDIRVPKGMGRGALELWSPVPYGALKPCIV